MGPQLLQPALSARSQALLEAAFTKVASFTTCTLSLFCELAVLNVCVRPSINRSSTACVLKQHLPRTLSKDMMLGENVSAERAR